MAIFCMNCGVNLVDDYIIRNGEEIPNPFVVCNNCGEWAGIAIPKSVNVDQTKDSEEYDRLVEEDKDCNIKSGKVSG
ncbi:MAG: hypothetical protein V1701_05725 [Planctomycetota bacterium]